jgi:hypothetical protein
VSEVRVFGVPIIVHEQMRPGEIRFVQDTGVEVKEEWTGRVLRVTLSRDYVLLGTITNCNDLLPPAETKP